MGWVILDGAHNRAGTSHQWPQLGAGMAFPGLTQGDVFASP
jgi:hypothetical protein